MKLFIAILLLSLCGCTSMLMGAGQISVKDAVELTRAEGGSGCIYLRVTGAYPGFATGTVTIIEAHDATGTVTFLDCLKALPEGQRTINLSQ